MRKRFMQLAALILAAALCAPVAQAAAGEQALMIRVGLAYEGNSYGARPVTRVKNDPGYGSGFRFGYFDGDLNFVELGRTQAQDMEIAILTTTRFYFANNTYYVNDPGGNRQTIGYYHVILPGSYATFEEARAAADGVEGGFVAWIKGTYQVRTGIFTSSQDAWALANQLGEGCGVNGTSEYSANVLASNTTQILFQFDAGEEHALGIMADVTGAEEVRTAWRLPGYTSYYRYRGGFRFERIDGGDMTVVNIVELEEYVKGVIPYEMANSWPLEALKAQAVCARGYVIRNLNKAKHRPFHFDVCDTADCQRYLGLGPYNRSTYSANETTDRAAEETRGQVVWYGDMVAETFYSSSTGGASEEIANVWTTNEVGDYPYLCGVADPYEATVADKNIYSSWTASYSAQELTRQINSKGYGVGTSVDHLELTYSQLGNVIKVVVHWANGQTNTFRPTSIRSVFDVRSIRFTVNGQTVQGSVQAEPEAPPQAPSQGGAPSGSYAVNGAGTLSGAQGLYVITGNGEILQAGEDLHIITGDGHISPLEEPELAPQPEPEPEPQPDAGPNQGGGTVIVSGGSYVFEGGGWGHQIGMSQYGANAMARLGFAYADILTFYYPGTTVGSYA